METEKDLRNWLIEAIGDFDQEDLDIMTFREAGLLTSNEGLVLRFESGEEFQLTIVRSE